MIGPAARDGWRCAWRESRDRQLPGGAALFEMSAATRRSSPALGRRGLRPRNWRPGGCSNFLLAGSAGLRHSFICTPPASSRAAARDVSFSRLVFLFQAYLPAHTRQRRRNAQFKTVQGLLHVTRDFTLISGTILRFSSTDEFVTRTLFEAATRAGALKNI